MSANDDEAAMQPAAQATPNRGEGTPQDYAELHRALMARLAQSRDRAAFKALFDHFGPRIKSMMMKAGAPPAQAEDLAQDVMMTVWRKVDMYAPERGSVSTWIFTIARNARIDRLRRSRSAIYDDIEDVELASEEAGSDDQVFAAQQAAGVASAMAELPADQKLMIEMAYMQDKSQSEIAAELSIPLGTVKSRLRLAYGKLKDRLEDLR